jgi:signal transduction histidine kinase
MLSRFSGLKKIGVLIMAILINVKVIQYMPNFNISVKFFLYFIISLFLSQVIYKGKIFIKAFFILVANFIFLISDVIAGNISSYLIKINIQSILDVLITSFSFSVFAKILNVIFIVICINNFKKIRFKIPQKYLIIMDIIVFLLVITLQFIMHISPILQKSSNKYSLYILGISLGLIIISGLIIFFFAEICYYHETEEENYKLSARNHLLEQQLSYHDSATSDIAKMRHDINNNLINISSLLTQKNINESITYIHAITKALEGTKAIVHCGNDIIDSILNYKIVVCKQHDIDIQVDIDHVPHLSVNPVDLTAILANILDNAIEALDYMEKKERYISGRIFCYKNYLSIVIKNPYLHEIKVVNHRIDTHKEDKLHHGYGLTSIRSSAEKNGGSFKIYTKNNVFSAVVMIPIEICCDNTQLKCDIQSKG